MPLFPPANQGPSFMFTVAGQPHSQIYDENNNLLAVRNAADSAYQGLDASQFTVRTLLNMVDGINMGVGTTTGTRIGTSTGQKVGFWNVGPSTQLTVTGGRIVGTALTNLLTALNTIGIIVDASTA